MLKGGQTRVKKGNSAMGRTVLEHLSRESGYATPEQRPGEELFISQFENILIKTV
jgi:hypothetical protein